MNKKRWLEILNHLNSQTPITSERLGQRLNLSSRTVRSEIKELNDVLEKEGAHLVSRTKTGTILIVDDPVRYQRFLDSLQKPIGIPETSEERIQVLLEILLTEPEGYVKIEDLCQRLYVSRSSLTSDMREVRRLLGRYHLQLVSRPGYGIRVKGKEFDLRLCLAAWTIHRMNQADHGLQDRLQVISDCIQQALVQSSLKINDVSFQNLIVHIYVALKRIEEGWALPDDSELNTQLENEKELTAASKIVELLQAAIKISIPETEIQYIALHLASKRIIESSSEVQNIVINTEISEIVTAMLQEIKKSYNFDFHDDLELRMMLSMHLIPFTVRIQNDMSLKNPMLKEIKIRYTLAYMLAITASEVIQKKYKKTVQEDEIGYFALYFNLALERRKRQVRKKNVLIVCSTGRGSAQLLVWRIKEEFKNELNRVETCDILHLEKYDCTDIDYIISTVPIPFKVCRPVLLVEVFLEQRDIQAIRTLISEESSSRIAAYFHPELFISDLQAETREEVLLQMTRQIEKVKEIPENFLELLLERERLAYTAFGNLAAIPHPNKAVTADTFVCVAILRKPIQWDRQKVQFVFLFSLKKDADEDMQLFSRVTAKLLFNGEAIKELIRNPSFLTLMQILKTIEKEMDR